jgi:hypothetical protein
MAAKGSNRGVGENIVAPAVRRDFWELLIDRHPIEEKYASSTGNAYRWRSLPRLRLVIAQFISQHGVGVFVRGERGVNPADVEHRLRQYAARVKKALSVDQFVNVGHGTPAPRYFFQKGKSFDSSRRGNWGRMADWLHREANAYEAALYKIIGTGRVMKKAHEWGIGELTDGTIDTFPMSELPKRIAQFRARELMVEQKIVYGSCEGTPTVLVKGEEGFAWSVAEQRWMPGFYGKASKAGVVGEAEFRELFPGVPPLSLSRETK